MAESEANEADTALLQEALTRKEEKLLSLQEQLQQLKAECEQLRQENRKFKTQRASWVATGNMTNADDSEDDEPDLATKMSVFLHKTFSLRQPRTVFAREDVFILALNSLMTLHHFDHSREMTDSDLSLSPTAHEQSAHPDTVFFWKGARIAFAYALLFLKQLTEECEDETRRDAVQRNFPLQWLLGVFPAIFPPKPTDFTSLSWLPLHIFLAANPASLYSASDVNKYVDDLGLLLDVFGESALTEDVKPLSILVAKRTPCLPAIEFYVEQAPGSLWTEDEDGSIPLMHACANNEDTEIVEWLLSKYQEQQIDLEVSKALYHVDQFGCAAIHYAAFNGRTNMLQFLLGQDPKLASLAESNGALPLHDAIQNKFGTSEQYRMVQLLLDTCLSAARIRDAQGAFPLHIAAKHSSVSVLELIYDAFPYAIYAPDAEGLLPLHYYAERSQQEKSLHMDVQSFLLEKNPKSTVYNDEQLVKMETAALRSAHQQQQHGGGGGGGISSLMSSWFRPKEALSKPAKGMTNANVSSVNDQTTGAASSPTGNKKMRRSSAVKATAHGR